MIFLLPHTPQEEYAAESKAYWNKYFAEKKKLDYMTNSANDWSGAEPTYHSKEEYSNIVEYAKNKGVNIYNINEFDGDTEMLKEQIDVISAAQKEYKIKGKITVSVGNMADDDFAETTNMSIKFNKKALRNKPITEKNLQADNLLAADNSKGIAMHEMGHIISKQYGEKGIALSKQAYYNIYKEELTTKQTVDYLQTHISEYSSAYRWKPDMPIKEKYFREITPEILSKNTSNQTVFTKEFERLLKEEIK